jgi:hypothetical protein
MIAMTPPGPRPRRAAALPLLACVTGWEPGRGGRKSDDSVREWLIGEPSLLTMSPEREIQDRLEAILFCLSG